MEPTLRTHVSDIFESQLFSINTFAGRFWSAIHTLTGNGCRSFMFKSALEVHKIATRSFEEHLQEFENAYKDGTSHEGLESEAYYYARNYLSHLDDEDKPTLSIIKQLIDIENRIQSPFPWDLLSSLACGEELTPERENKIKKWIRKIEQLGDLITVTKLQQILDYYLSLNPSGDLIVLECKLLDLGLCMLSAPDPLHMDWRNSLSPGMQFTLTDKTFTLKKELGKKENFNKTRVFTLEESEKYVFISATNPFELAHRQALIEKKQWALFPPRFKGIDPLGRYAIIEAFPTPIKEARLNHEMMKTIARAFGFFIKNDMMPNFLEVSNFRFDKNKLLRTTRLIEPVPLNIFDIAQFFDTLSDGNSEIYHFLLDKSQLASHPQWQYLNQEIFSDRRAAQYGVTNSHFIEQAKSIKRGAPDAPLFNLMQPRN